jgi:hypothetical protein
MQVLANVLVFLHLIAMAAIVGGFLFQLRSPIKRVSPGMWHGSLLALVTGLAIVGLYESVDSFGEPINHVKIGVKLALSVVIAVLAFMGRKREDWRTGWLSVGLLAIAAVAVAVFWQ